ncbi:MAG: IS3 family transposase [Candidatus Thiodiazotropha sp. (ex. Lucinisca nassula)]|nr:IS3 family transposase [Candidatus Thiodiazotropha sp. (ex. Lucinisca nassula)]MBW9269270.1 IS3 family transposase [Candidatus Thiodiazotropha sp. (ex. Lucinisca nassula)]
MDSPVFWMISGFSGDECPGCHAGMLRLFFLYFLRMAIEARHPASQLVHHSDRGGQYQSEELRAELAKHGIEASMGRTGDCYDNAVAESFFGLMKRERVNRVRYRTREEAQADLFEYIEVFYTRKRRHGYLGNISPDQFEQRRSGLSETAH